MGPLIHPGRVSFSGLPLCQPIREIQYQNTYKTQPDQGCKFDASRVQSILEAALATHLAEVRYNQVTSSQLTQRLSEIIRSKVKEATPPRYRLVCQVILGQRKDQGVRIASRCLWDPENDNFATASYTNASLFAVVTVHGLYYE
ncbi:dynein light chain Tctex-type 4 [Latimeria chalumnae]